MNHSTGHQQVPNWLAPAEVCCAAENKAQCTCVHQSGPFSVGKLWTLCRIAWPRVTTSATTAGGVPDRKCEPRSRDIPSLQGAPVVYGFGHPNFCGFPIDFPTEFPGFSTRCPGFWIQFLIHSCQVHDRGLGGNDVWHLGTPHRALSLRSSIELMIWWRAVKLRLRFGWAPFLFGGVILGSAAEQSTTQVGFETWGSSFNIGYPH